MLQKKKKKLDEYNTINCVYVFLIEALVFENDLFSVMFAPAVRLSGPRGVRQSPVLVSWPPLHVYRARRPSLPNRRCPAHVFWRHVAADPFTILNATSESFFSSHFVGGEIPNPPLWRRVVSITEVLRCCFVDGSSLCFVTSQGADGGWDCLTAGHTVRLEASWNTIGSHGEGKRGCN